MKRKTLLSWSSGKDSAWALHVLRQQDDIEVAGLVCTVNQTFDRVAMHAVRRELLQAQADSAGLPLETIEIPYPCSNDIYEQRMKTFIELAQARGIDCIAFGDLYLEDVRRYREEKMRGTGITPIFPLWGLPTHELSRQMISGGLKARITCIDPKHLPATFAGRDYDQRFLDELPQAVDACGENGEFHSFAYAGPMFKTAIAIETGESVERDGFVFADLKAV